MPSGALTVRPEYDNIFSFKNQLNKVFDNFFSDDLPLTSALTRDFGSDDLKKWSPRCDVYEGDKEFTFHCELPGMKKEDVHVEINDDLLTISGQSEQTTTSNEHTTRVHERRFGRFQRSFALGRDVKKDDVQAKFENGILEVVVPKKEGQTQAARRIDIK